MIIFMITTATTSLCCRRPDPHGHIHILFLIIIIITTAAAANEQAGEARPAGMMKDMELEKL